VAKRVEERYRGNGPEGTQGGEFEPSIAHGSFRHGAPVSCLVLTTALRSGTRRFGKAFVERNEGPTSDLAERL
jgi:hypothetical protein